MARSSRQDGRLEGRFPRHKTECEVNVPVFVRKHEFMENLIFIQNLCSELISVLEILVSVESAISTQS